MFAVNRLYRLLLVLALAVSVVAPSSIVAQQPVAEPDVAMTATASPSIPFSTPSGAAAPALLARSPTTWALSESPEALLPPQERRAGPNVALMAVGGAALVTGLVIGEDGGLIIATGGAVVGLLGLYRYLR